MDIPGSQSRQLLQLKDRPKDDVVSCRVCFVSGDIVGWICGTQSNEGPRSRCFTLGLWFHVGFRADLVMFFMLFRVGSMSGMLGASKFIALKTAKHHKFLCSLGHGVDWAKHVVSCRVGVSCQVCGCPILIQIEEESIILLVGTGGVQAAPGSIGTEIVNKNFVNKLAFSDLVAPSTGWMLYHLCFTIGLRVRQGVRLGGPYLALSRIHTRVGVLNRFVLNHPGNSTSRLWCKRNKNPFKTNAKQKCNRVRDSQQTSSTAIELSTAGGHLAYISEELWRANGVLPHILWSNNTYEKSKICPLSGISKPMVWGTRCSWPDFPWFSCVISANPSLNFLFVAVWVVFIIVVVFVILWMRATCQP